MTNKEYNKEIAGINKFGFAVTNGQLIQNEKDRQTQTKRIEAKHYPKPEYCKCNAGHGLVEIYNEKKNCFDWDCPICKAKMEKLGCFSSRGKQ